tara:strand:- start:17179 stop:17529 length:351 start_codon:yes stop_codon:yes gene_type:complete
LLASFTSRDKALNSFTNNWSDERVPTRKEKKAILIDYYSKLIKNDIDKRFDESKDGNINEREMIANLVLLTDYGCAYSGSGCTGTQVCGVSELYARTFGYLSYNTSLPCKPTGGIP